MFKTIFLKEMKDVLRDKRSISLLVFLPIIMMSGLTFFYDKILSDENKTNYSVAVENGTDPEFMEKLTSYAPDIDVKKAENAKKAVENKDVQIGLRVEEGWKGKLASGQPVSVDVIYDPGSQESSGASALIMSAISQWESETVQSRLADRNIEPNVMHVFQVKENTTKEEDNAIASFMLAILLPLLIPISIANGSYPSATELFAGEKEKKTFEALAITPVKPIKILLAKWLTISLLGIFTGLLCVVVLGLEINFTTELKKGFAVMNNPKAFLVMSIVLVVMFAVFIAALEMILSMLANSVKEAGYYISPVIGLMSLPIMVMFFTDETLNMGLYAVPGLNLFLFVRDSFSDQMTWSAFAVAAASYAAIIAILFPIASKLFHNRKIMLGK